MAQYEDRGFGKEIASGLKIVLVGLPILGVVAFGMWKATPWLQEAVHQWWMWFQGHF